MLILQARMGSTRLPGKSMMDLAGAPLVGRLLERVERCQRVDEIVLATTQQPEDYVIAELAARHRVALFRGAENDLVDRYYQAALAYRAEVIVRLPADNPVPEPSEIDRLIAYHLTGYSDFSTNLAPALGNGYPDGIGAEALDIEILEEIWKNCTDPFLREHPHRSFFDYKTQTVTDPARYHVGTVACPAEFSRPDLKLDVDTPADYAFMSALYTYLYPRNPRFHITDIIEWYDNVYHASPELTASLQ